MTLLKLAEKHKFQAVYIIGEDGEASMVDWDEATREKFGHVQVHRVGQRLWESPWQVHQYPQENVSYGVVVSLA